MSQDCRCDLGTCAATPERPCFCPCHPERRGCFGCFCRNRSENLNSGDPPTGNILGKTWHSAKQEGE